MSEATFEAVESEGFEAAGEGFEGEAAEGSFEGEAGEAQYEGYPEDARSDARRRARQRQILLARQRQAQSRRPARAPQPRRPAVPAPAAQRQVMTAIRSLDLDTKVELDSLRRALNEANRLAYRNAWAAEASAAASQVLDSFDTGLAPHDWARAVIRGAPTLLLAPGKPRRPGLEGVLFDPRVAGGLALAGIWAIGHFRGQSQGVSDIRVANPSPLTVGDAATFSAYPVDSHGKTVTTATITWSSDNKPVLSVDPSTGDYVANSPGTANVTATVGDVTVPFSVTVVAAAAGAAGAAPAAPAAGAAPAAPAARAKK